MHKLQIVFQVLFNKASVWIKNLIVLHKLQIVWIKNLIYYLKQLFSKVLKGQVKPLQLNTNYTNKVYLTVM